MYVYLLTNKVNGKKYVGQTSRTIPVRWNEHCAYARHGRRDSALYNAIRRHGPDSFEVTQLEQSGTVEDMNRLEEFWITMFNTMDKSVGYNLMTGGQAPSPNQETREKLSRVLKGKPAWNKGISPSPEAIEKQRTSLKGYVRSEEFRRKCSEVKKGKNNPNYGRKLSPEQLLKMREGRKGLVWNKGIKATEEFRAKLRGPRPGTRGANNHLFQKDISTQAIWQLRSIGFTHKAIAETLCVPKSTIQGRLKGFAECTT